MTRFLVMLMALFLVACSSTGEATTSTSQSPVETAVTTTDPGPSSDPADTTIPSGRPVAPDFTLELGEGGAYTLSEGEKPVYLVFWAEW